MTHNEKHAPLTPAEREQVITTILACRWGIYGAEVCQVCGRVGVFKTWAGAMVGHLPYPGNVFVAQGHDHGGRDASVALLKKREERFCEICRKPVAQAVGLQVGSRWLCRPCANNQPEETLQDALMDLSRRRYLRMRGDNTLRRWSQRAAQTTNELQS